MSETAQSAKGKTLIERLIVNKGRFPPFNPLPTGSGLHCYLRWPKRCCVFANFGENQNRYFLDALKPRARRQMVKMSYGDFLCSGFCACEVVRGLYFIKYRYKKLVLRCVCYNIFQ